MDEFICRFSIPHQLNSDQGRNFEAAIIQDICKLLGVNKTRTTPYHPLSDGFVERFNRTMMDIVSKFIEPARRQRDWDEKLQLAMFAYRTTPQTPIGESPNMMMLGREANMPIDVLRKRPLPDENDTLTTDCAKDLRQNRPMSQRSAVRQKTHYDKRSRGYQISKGDFVWHAKKAKNENNLSKLDMKWEGPYPVTDKLSDVVFRIQRNGPRGSKKAVHYDHLKLYCGKPLESWLNKLKPIEAEEVAPSFTLQGPHEVVAGNASNVQDLQIPSDEQVMDALSVDNNTGANAGEPQLDAMATNLLALGSDQPSRFPKRQIRQPPVRYR